MMLDDSSLYSISYHKPQRLVRLVWLAGTAQMTDQDFKASLEAFAESILRHRAPRLIIDMREFKHRPTDETLAWRDDVIVPKYNQAGVKKIAWIWPGVTGDTTTSENDKAENYYCATEGEALAWVVA